jgi:DNA-binding XRE family transcriptional regulator
MHGLGGDHNRGALLTHCIFNAPGVCAAPRRWKSMRMANVSAQVPRSCAAALEKRSFASYIDHITFISSFNEPVTSMPKPATRPTSRYSRDALALLGQLIRRARIERRLTVAGLAERAGLSRGLVQRIESGDPGCAIGAVFETAAIVGVRLFDADQAALTRAISTNTTILALLPKTVRAPDIEAKDDF